MDEQTKTKTVTASDLRQMAKDAQACADRKILDANVSYHDEMKRLYILAEVNDLLRRKRSAIEESLDVGEYEQWVDDLFRGNYVPPWHPDYPKD